MLSQTALKAALSYDPESGVFTWRSNVGNVKAGSVAGCVNTKGYRYIGLGGMLHRANRLAWLYVHGVMPKGQIDHIDGDRLNDRIANLRDVDGFANQRNRKRGNKSSSSRLIGVSLHKQTGKWRAQISYRSTKHLGLFDTEEQAHTAYMAAKHEGNT